MLPSRVLRKATSAEKDILESMITLVILSAFGSDEGGLAGRHFLLPHVQRQRLVDEFVLPEWIDIPGFAPKGPAYVGRFFADSKSVQTWVRTAFAASGQTYHRLRMRVFDAQSAGETRPRAVYYPFGAQEAAYASRYWWVFARNTAHIDWKEYAKVGPIGGRRIAMSDNEFTHISDSLPLPRIPRSGSLLLQQWSIIVVRRNAAGRGFGRGGRDEAHKLLKKGAGGNAPEIAGAIR